MRFIRCDECAACRLKDAIPIREAGPDVVPYGDSDVLIPGTCTRQPEYLEIADVRLHGCWSGVVLRKPVYDQA